MIQGISLWGHRSEAYSGPESAKDYNYMFKKLPWVKSVRTWEATLLKGVGNNRLESWKENELKWKNKLFKDNGIIWHPCIGGFNKKPKKFFDKKMEIFISEFLNMDLTYADFEIANEPQGMIKTKWFESWKYSENEIINRHNILARHAININPNIKIVVSPYYYSHLPCDIEFYIKFIGNTFGRHIYKEYLEKNGPHIPHYVTRVDETDYKLWRSTALQLNSNLEEILYWFDKDHSVDTLSWKDYN